MHTPSQTVYLEWVGHHLGWSSHESCCQECTPVLRSSPPLAIRWWPTLHSLSFSTWYWCSCVVYSQKKFMSCTVFWYVIYKNRTQNSNAKKAKNNVNLLTHIIAVHSSFHRVLFVSNLLLLQETGQLELSSSHTLLWLLNTWTSYNLLSTLKHIMHELYLLPTEFKFIILSCNKKWGCYSIPAPPLFPMPMQDLCRSCSVLWWST